MGIAALHPSYALRSVQPVARMSAAICGGRSRAQDPGYRGACHRARVRATRWLIRATLAALIRLAN
jgi:hypothetical protein